jgi:hypothetical protein
MLLKSSPKSAPPVSRSPVALLPGKDKEPNWLPAPDGSDDAPVLAQGDAALNLARGRRDLEATRCCASRVAAL